MTEIKKKTYILMNAFHFTESSQLTFTCSKPTIETLEKVVKYVQS